MSPSNEPKDQFEKDGEVKGEKELVISKEELVPLMTSNLFLLFFVGFDTTSLGEKIDPTLNEFQQKKLYCIFCLDFRTHDGDVMSGIPS